jgi:hypothetical protein
MHYTQPSLMTQSMLDGASHRPMLPADETQEGNSSSSDPAASPRVATGTAAAHEAAAHQQEASSSRTGVIADSAPASDRARTGGSRLQPDSASSSNDDGVSLQPASPSAAQRLAQRALHTLHAQGAPAIERGSWPGGEEGVVGVCGI